MQLVPAPGRQFKTASMVLLIVIGLADLALVMAATFSEMDIISARTLALLNAGAVFLTGAVRLVKQQIEMTTEQKIELVEAAAAQPMKPGHENIDVKIDGELVPGHAPPK